MIPGVRDKKTEPFAEGEFVKAFRSFEDHAARRLSILDAAPSLDAALRLGHGSDPQFRFSLQRAWEIRIAQEKAGRGIAWLPIRGGVACPGAASVV